MRRGGYKEKVGRGEVGGDACNGWLELKYIG